MNDTQTTADATRATVSIGNYLTHLDETKRGLAKLLARENITVRHEAVPTAYFNIQDRTLVLPKFDNVTVDQYDLLIGHEVGHAKYSSGPESIGILKKCQEFDGLHSYVNVLEDTRIERLMKAEYPGLRGSFRRGYEDFAKYGPLFKEDPNESIGDNLFIDRINIQYKVGAHRKVPFSYEERALFPRIDALDSFEAVYVLAKELYDADVEAQKNNPDQANAEDTEDASDEEQSSEPPRRAQRDGEKDSEDVENNEQKKASSQAKGDGDDDTQSESDSQSEADSQKGDAETDSDDGQSSDDDAKKAEGDTDADTANTVGANTAPRRGPVAKTDVANTKALEGITSQEEENKSTPISVNLQPLTNEVVSKFVVSAETYTDDVLTFLKVYPDVENAAKLYLDEFTKQHGATIKYLAREFDLRKTAKLAERAKTSRTGRLDVTKLYAYKFREDLFKSVTILPNGKSHGIVVLIDASGSMQNVMSDTLDQALLFGSFAKAVGIPFKALIFTDSRYTSRHNNDSANVAPVESVPSLIPQECDLVTILDTTAPKWKNQLVAVAAFALRFDYGKNSIIHRGLAASGGANALYSLPHTSLGSTPLYSSLLIVENIVANLKSANRLDKTTLLIVTDGDDSSGLAAWLPREPLHASNINRYQSLTIRDTVTREVYANYRRALDRNDDVTHGWEADINAIPAALIGSIQKRHACRVVTIKVLPARFRYKTRRNSRYSGRDSTLLRAAEQFANPAKSLRTGRPAECPWSFTEDVACASFKATGQVVFKANDIIGDAAILVSATRFVINTNNEEDTSTQTPAQIKKAFVKHSVGATKNRVFVQTVVPFLA